MIVMAPKDENELRHMLKTAVEYPGPAALRFPRGIGAGRAARPEIKTLAIGEAELLHATATIVAIVAIGSAWSTPRWTAAHEPGVGG